MTRQQRVTKVAQDKDRQRRNIHIGNGERREMRATLGSRKARKSGTKAYSNRARHKVKLSMRPRLRMRALVDKLTHHKLQRAGLL